MPLLFPLAFDLFKSIGSGFDAMMQPLYSAVAGLIVMFHWVFSRFMDPDSGVTWVLSIISLTFLIRTALIPLFMRQLRSSRNMQLIQPKMQELQKKYGHDRERLGQETMKLYKEEGVNPMSSCLPLLLQMPIFWALFSVLNGAARNHPQGSFLRDRPHLVESLRNADLFGAKLSESFLPFHGFGPNQIFTALLVVGLVVSLFITQLEMTRKNMPPEALTGPMAQQQKIMLYTMPLMYLFTGLSIPSGVLVYWLTSNLWTLVQQWLIIRNSPAPNTPAYLDWEERMRAKGLDPRQIEAERAAKRNRKRAAAATRTDASGEPAKVQRQDLSGGRVVRRKGGSTVAPPPSSGVPPLVDDAAAAEDDGPTVIRQQPRRQARSVRRKK